ncbi:MULTISPECIES: filamentous hemagglutinin N-terminal domain-containing protein [unclassified Nostoc]|uniref:filamentous hemagglutinin N-terminal domain-containing protein n=1 Tax=unclassified Nostoc TaxID=2593658 RepID=UPI00261C2F80|nr:filamentous hemagglutinin N-terminal domain-containing protein [Nostoc sp. S13]MDF5735422.1 filamentous hemagglutinin N-terminal domain-containing protein [Nostoc sp. S13]
MSLRNWFGYGCHLKLLGLVILVGAIGIEGGDRTCAQVTPDPSVGTQVKRMDNTTLDITGGTTVGNTNLFHSFSNFSVKSNEVVNFNNAPTINNILVRVTGGNPSDIQGTLQTEGKANLFLINPNGIIFGGYCQLIIGGSFIATTASAIRFPGGGEFSMISPVNPLNPLLRVNPSAFLFNQILSQPIKVNEATLSVLESQSLVLLGGDVNLEGAFMSAPDGRVELGGLAGVGAVGLNIDNNNFRLSFPDSVARADVSLTNHAAVDASGEGGGSIQVQGKRVTLADGSYIAVDTLVSKSGGVLVVNASELVELLGGSSLSTETTRTATAGELRIETGRLIVQDGSQVRASTSNQGQGGTLSVTADSIQLIGTLPGDDYPSGLFTVTQGAGNAGELKIKTGQLIVQDGAEVSASTYKESTGNGGSIIVKAKELNVLNNGEITVSSQGTKKAGDLEITARSINLDNGQLSGQANSGNGGNIDLNLRDLLLLRRNSQISTSAGTDGAGGDGGKITISAPDGFIVAKPNENSDITANAYNGKGGTVTIKATKIFGIASLTSEDLKRLRPNDSDPGKLQTNDITAISQISPNLSGIVKINTLDVDPYRGLLINLPAVPVNTKVSQVCQAGTAQNKSSFTITGRGGLPRNPYDLLSPNAVLVDWVTLDPRNENHISTDVSTQATRPTSAPIVEAQGWVRNAKGEIVLIADAPTTTLHSSWEKPANCRNDF